MSRAHSLPRPLALPNWRLSPLLSSLLMLALVLAGLWALVPEEAPLTRLEVRGHFERMQAHDVQRAVEPYLSNSFFALDMHALRDAVAQLPWVAQVRAERHWPGMVSVRIVERQPYARWNDDGLLDTEARAFVPRAAQIPAGLPLLGGSPGHEIEVAHTWERVSRVLANTPAALAGLQLEARGEWTARTDSGIELRFGQSPPDEKLPMLRDVVLRTLDGRWPQVEYVDLRYTNGFAVGWREAETTGADEP